MDSPHRSPWADSAGHVSGGAERPGPPHLAGDRRWRHAGAFIDSAEHAALARATAGMALQLRECVADARAWDSASGCGTWSVRDLVNHVVGCGYRYLGYLQGLPWEALADTRSRDYSGRALADFSLVSSALEAAFASTAPDVVVSHPAGECTAYELLVMRVTECSVHSWDLAATRGVDATSIDPLAAEFVLAQGAHVVARLRELGYFRPQQAPTGAGPQAALLGLCGRSA